jgi:hypothetical protein
MGVKYGPDVAPEIDCSSPNTNDHKIRSVLERRLKGSLRHRLLAYKEGHATSSRRHVPAVLSFDFGVIRNPFIVLLGRFPLFSPDLEYNPEYNYGQHQGNRAGGEKVGESRPYRPTMIQPLNNVCYKRPALRELKKH